MPRIGTRDSVRVPPYESNGSRASSVGSELRRSLDPKRNPTWDAMFKKCDAELLKSLKDRVREWRQDDAFFSSAIASLHAVKNAWRNPTMHVERRYDMSEATDVLNAVGGFMRHLATKLTA